MKLLEEIRNDLSGMALLNDWVGDGGVPVSQERAEARANICVFGIGGKRCPKNVESGWWDRVKSSIANTIKMQLEIKHHLNLHVKQEDDLWMCSCCGCALPTKVWVPTKHLKEHTDPNKFKDAPPMCWVRQEIEQ